MSKPSATPSIETDLRNILGQALWEKVVNRVSKRLEYSPVIVFMGKTGAGKSSACNALFGSDLFKVSDVAVGTRSVQVESHQNGLTLVDVPGVGEGGDYSKRYRDLYETILHKGVTDARTGETKPVDAIVWLVKSDDRALEIDKVFYDEVFSKHLSADLLKRLTFAISQCDAMAPIRGDGSWDTSDSRPGSKQAANLDQKRRQISEMFRVNSNRVVEFSSTEFFNLDRLLEQIVDTLPDTRKAIAVMAAEKAAEKAKRSEEKTVSERSKVKASKDVLTMVVEAVTEYAPVLVPAVKALASVAKSAWKLLKSLF